jgi:hypothetical protein
MLAADCSDLPGRLRHLIHVMALHADNATGVGLTGQDRLGDYLGCGARHVRTMLTQLDELWESGVSPVRIVREKRFQNSDRYVIEVREGAPLERPKRIHRSGQERIPRSGSTGSTDPQKRAHGSAPPPTGPDLEALQSTEVSLQRDPQSKENQTTSLPPAAGPEGPRGAGGQATEDARRAARLAASQRLAAAARERLGV